MVSGPSSWRDICGHLLLPYPHNTTVSFHPLESWMPPCKCSPTMPWWVIMLDETSHAFLWIPGNMRMLCPEWHIHAMFPLIMTYILPFFELGLAFFATISTSNSMHSSYLTMRFIYWWDIWLVSSQGARTQMPSPGSCRIFLRKCSRMYIIYIHYHESPLQWSCKVPIWLVLHNTWTDTFF